jgi:hypothetical protein
MIEDLPKSKEDTVLRTVSPAEFSAMMPETIKNSFVQVANKIRMASDLVQAGQGEFLRDIVEGTKTIGDLSDALELATEKMSKGEALPIAQRTLGDYIELTTLIPKHNPETNKR